MKEGKQGSFIFWHDEALGFRKISKPHCDRQSMTVQK